MMNTYLQAAMDMAPQIREDRRYFHQNAEVGVDLPLTAARVLERLREMGYDPQEICQGGIVATVGKPGGRTLLLRADMDALPMAELSGLPFASQSPEAAHTCGHDMHAAMLLGAARLLKEHEDELEGCVRLMFQPDEEALTGAKLMIEAGVLEGVDAGFALHVFPGKAGPGSFMARQGAVMASQDRFVIEIEGHGGHGAMPHVTVDPINVGVHIHLALQELVAREIDTTQPVVITVGRFAGGDAANIIPQTTVLEGTIRCFSPEVRAQAKQRLEEVSVGTAALFRAKAAVSFPVETPPNMNDPALATEMEGYVKEMGAQVYPMPPAMGSEDFAFVSERIPTAYFGVGAGGPEPEYSAAANHHPRVVFNEEALPYGAAAYAWCAVQWLRNNG